MFKYKLKFKVDDLTPELETAIRNEAAGGDEEDIELIFDHSNNTVVFVLPSEIEIPEEITRAFTEVVARMCKESFPDSTFTYVEMTHDEIT